MNIIQAQDLRGSGSYGAVSAARSAVKSSSFKTYEELDKDVSVRVTPWSDILDESATRDTEECSEE